MCPDFSPFERARVVLRVLAKLECEPRAVMFDGQGIAHPRRMGLAAHMGLWLDVPTVGIAKSLLRGRFREPREKAGSTSALMLDGEQVGCVVRTRSSVRPVFVSPGDKLGITGAVRLTLRCCSGLRIPEPTRLAHIAAGAARSRGLEGEQLLQHVNTFARPPK
ncbi:MAG: endonuclease V [Planctomycetota bacterium]|nr:endonuclease V [Planctomycetota bacterium]